MTRGVVVSFDLHRGFGFIRSASYRDDVFVHISAVEGHVPLRAGQRVEFVAEPDERGLRAKQVVPGARGLSPAMAAAGILIGVLVGLDAALLRFGLGWFGAWLGAIGVVTWAAYAWDKRQATLERRRVPEAVLLGLALIGGSPAAAMAMFVLRHKTRKRSFLAGFVGVLVAQVGIAAAYGYFRTR